MGKLILFPGRKLPDIPGKDPKFSEKEMLQEYLELFKPFNMIFFEDLSSTHTLNITRSRINPGAHLHELLRVLLDVDWITFPE